MHSPEPGLDPGSLRAGQTSVHLKIDINGTTVVTVDSQHVKKARVFQLSRIL